MEKNIPVVSQDFILNSAIKEATYIILKPLIKNPEFNQATTRKLTIYQPSTLTINN